MDLQFGVLLDGKNNNPRERRKSKKKNIRNLQSFCIPSVRTNEIHPVNPKLTAIALTNVKQSARCSSLIIALLVFIVATIALIVKWLLLQPIHNELVNKYQEKEPVYYDRNSFCDIIDLQDFNLLTFPIACFLILIFVIFAKRTSCLREKCKGYVAPVIPLDFYIHVKRKFAAVVFAIVADELLDIITQVLTGNTSSNQGTRGNFLLSFPWIVHFQVSLSFTYYGLLKSS